MGASKAAPTEERGFKEEDYYGWRCDDEWADSYINHCQKAVKNEAVFANFRSSVKYGPILEHVPPSLGAAYLENIFINNTFLVNHIDKFISINDRVGSPQVCDFEIGVIKKKFKASPTTLRYVKVLSDLISLYGSLYGLNIVEIGGGYGGLAAVIKAQFSFNSYYDVDLRWPGVLAKKYTSAVGIDNFIPITPEKLDDLEDVKIDLVISNYAFSECNRETRDIYIDKIFSRAATGYITHNGDDARRNETQSSIEGYRNFRIFDQDLSRREVKRHPIFVWDAR